jgi:hypothetical protein
LLPRRTLALLSAPFICFTLACQHGLTLPPDDEGPSGPLEVGKIKLRERRNILPGNVSGPPAPEPGIYAGQCGELEQGGSITGPDCLSGVLHCGDTIVGHTVGGVNRFTTQFYEKKFCTPATTNHDGGDERVYRIDLPEGDRTALVTLDSPCADLDVAAVKWKGDTCPGVSHAVNACEMWPKPKGQRETVRIVSQKASSWLIVVEGKDEEEGAFSLSVQCWTGLI